MKNILKQQDGMTLVEFIVVAFILVTVSGIIVGVVYSVFRGSSRSHESISVSGNGNYASSVITQILVSAVDVTEVGGESVADCTEISSGVYPSGTSIEVQNPDGGLTTLACENEIIASNGAALIDSFDVRTVEGSCNFICRQESAYVAPLIEVSFELESKNFDYVTDITKEAFKSSATLRNY